MLSFCHNPHVWQTVRRTNRRDGQTDGRTDRQTDRQMLITIPRSHSCSAVKCQIGSKGFVLVSRDLLLEFRDHCTYLNGWSYKIQICHADWSQGVGLLSKYASSDHLRGLMGGLATLYYKSIMVSDAMLDCRYMREWSHVDETWWNYKGRHAKVIWSVYKPEVKFQYGNRLFFETGCS